MTTVRLGKWGGNLAVRMPHEMARRLGLSEGERVEIEAQDGDILIRRTQARDEAREMARAAARALLARRPRPGLDREAIRALVEEGRR